MCKDCGSNTLMDSQKAILCKREIWPWLRDRQAATFCCEVPRNFISGSFPPNLLRFGSQWPSTVSCWLCSSNNFGRPSFNVMFCRKLPSWFEKFFQNGSSEVYLPPMAWYLQHSCPMLPLVPHWKHICPIVATSRSSTSMAQGSSNFWRLDEWTHHKNAGYPMHPAQEFDWKQISLLICSSRGLRATNKKLGWAKAPIRGLLLPNSSLRSIDLAPVVFLSFSVDSMSPQRMNLGKQSSTTFETRWLIYQPHGLNFKHSTFPTWFWVTFTFAQWKILARRNFPRMEVCDEGVGVACSKL